MKATLKLESGFEDLITKLAKKGKDVDGIVRKVLKESADITQKEINEEAKKHNFTGLMAMTEINPTIEEVKNRAYRVKVGFDMDINEKGALHAIFLNYGTPKRKVHGKVPSTRFFTKAISRTKKDRQAIQERIIKELGN